MSENINWIQVVIDYCIRFPDITYGELFCNNCVKFGNIKIGDLLISMDLKILYEGKEDWNLIVCGSNVVEYFVYNHGWKYASDIILLRLLTEGKEDLI